VDHDDDLFAFIFELIDDRHEIGLRGPEVSTIAPNTLT
jgi:hypothetical protein